MNKAFYQYLVPTNKINGKSNKFTKFASILYLDESDVP